MPDPINKKGIYNIFKSPEIIDILKLPSKLQSDPIFVGSSMYYLSKKNKLYILN